VLALDALRALGKFGVDPVRRSIERLLAQAPSEARAIREAFDAANRWLDVHAKDRDALEAGARGLALTLARVFASALLARHAARAQQDDVVSEAALKLFISHGLDRLHRGDRAAERVLSS